MEGIALSMPAVVGLKGVESHVPIALDEEEMEMLKRSADTLKEVIGSLDLS